MPLPLPPPPPPHLLHHPPLQLARFAALQPGLDERFAALRDAPEDATLDDALDALYEARALVVLDGHDGALDAPGAPANVSQKGDHRRRALSLDALLRRLLQNTRFLVVILTRREPLPGTVLPGAAPQQLTLQPLERGDGLQLWRALCPLPATCAAALDELAALVGGNPGRIYDVVARLRAPGHADKSIEERLRLLVESVRAAAPSEG